jgi:very-short-patch-repair endonuclease
VIECDGRRFHRTPERILRDAERDRVLRAGGFAVLRLLWDQVVYEPERTLARVVAFYRANAGLARR